MMRDESTTNLNQKSEQVQKFEKEGFLIVRDVLDQKQIQSLVEMGDQMAQSDRLDQRQRDLYMDGFRNVIAMDKRVLPLLTHPKTFPLVVQLLGPDIQLHTSHLIWKKTNHKSEVNLRAPQWHRDIARVTRCLSDDCMPRIEIKIAYFLSDCTESGCGQTLFASGSHLWKEPWEPDENNIDPPGLREPLLKAGDAVLFENRTWHAGGPNLCDRIRKTIMLGYSYRWMRPDDYDQQSEELLSQCDEIQRSLMEVKHSCFTEQGEFNPNGESTPLEDWAKQN